MKLSGFDEGTSLHGLAFDKIFLSVLWEAEGQPKICQ